MKLRAMVRRLSGRCTQCGGRMIPIVYGYPTPELWDDAEAGKVVIGGCVIYEGLSPSKVCRECVEAQ